MAKHQLEVRVAVDYPSATVLVLCSHCGTQEEFKIDVEHLPPVITTLFQVLNDMGLPVSQPAAYSTKEDCKTTEEINAKMKRKSTN